MCVMIYDIFLIAKIIQVRVRSLLYIYLSRVWVPIVRAFNWSHPVSRTAFRLFLTRYMDNWAILDTCLHCDPTSYRMIAITGIGVYVHIKLLLSTVHTYKFDLSRTRRRSSIMDSIRFNWKYRKIHPTINFTRGDKGVYEWIKNNRNFLVSVRGLPRL